MNLMKAIKQTLYLIFFAMPLIAQDVILDIAEVDVDGYTQDIVVPVSMNNPNHAVGGIQFDLAISPSMVSVSGVDPESSLTGFVADFTNFLDGSSRVLMYNQSAPDGISAGGSGIVLNLHFDGTNVLSALLVLEMSDVIVSAIDGQTLTTTATNGTITIGDVASLSMSNATGDVNETVELSFSLTNDGSVGGVQFDLFDTPDYVDATSFTTTDRTAGFNVSFSEIGEGVRVILLSEDNADIAPGDGPILTGQFFIHENAYAGDAVLNYENVIVTDSFGGEYWIASADTGVVTVFPGYIEEPGNLVAESGLDNRVELSWEAPVGPIPPTVPFTIEILTDNFPGETSWDLRHMDGDTLVASIASGDLTDAATEYTWDLEIPSGAYIFTIYDTFGDGICCAYGVGNYRLILDGVEFASGGEFASDESVTFNTNDGRYNRIQHVYLTDMPYEKESGIESVRTDYSLSHPIFMESGYFEVSEPNVQNIREIEIDEYHIYRSVGNDQNFEDLSVVDGTVTEYTDLDVDNSVTYYYYVTAMYPSGVESGPTNTVSATPVEWVEISISSGSALSGQTDTLDIFISNETDIGLFYFEIMDNPNVIESYAALTTDRTDGWSIDVVDLPSGAMAVTGFTFGTPLIEGDGPVCRVIVYPVADQATTAMLTFSNASSIQDMNSIPLNWTSSPGFFDVTIETQYLTITDGQGLAGGTADVSVILQNTQDIYGIQFDLANYPPMLTGISFSESSDFDFSDWSIEGEQIGNNYRILMNDNTLQNPISAGLYHLGDVSYSVSSSAPDGQVVEVTVGNMVLSDINAIPMHAEANASAVYVGTPPALYSIENVSGNLAPGGTGTFEIHLANTEAVFVSEFSLVDIPNDMIINEMTGMGRFVNGVIDNPGEGEGGAYDFSGYDFATGIAAGDGAIISVDVTFSQTINTNSLVILLKETFSADVTFSGISSHSIGFGQFTGGTVSNENELSIPGEFALHANYPNPFNPTTIIAYDLAKQSNVDLIIYDLMGREIRTLVHLNQSAGKQIAVWDGRDNMGQAVSAGVYIYQLRAGDFLSNRKMVFMK